MRDNDTILLESIYEEMHDSCKCSACGANMFDEVVEESKKTSCNGYIVFHGRNYVCIATNVYDESRNPKTGDMVQVYIIRSDMDPKTAISTGKDNLVCFNCKLRGTIDPETKKLIPKTRTCYVNPVNLLQVYKTYKAGRYPLIIKDKNLIPSLNLTDDDVEIYLQSGNWDIFSGKFIRFGAYGEPVRIPYPIIEKMASSSAGFTAYTHQWQASPFQAYKKFCMASVDTAEEYRQAKDMGWRTFRVSPSWYMKSSEEEPCQYSVDRTQCVDCLKCSGTTSNTKDIYVMVHGSESSGKVDNFIENFGTESDFSEPLTNEDLENIQKIEALEQEEKSVDRNEVRDKASDLELLMKSQEEKKSFIEKQ